MPVALTRADRRLLVFAGTLMAIVLTVAFFLASGVGSDGELTTSYSSSSAGMKAAYEMLLSTGYRAERWEDPPSALGNPESTTLILAEPLEIPTEADREALASFMTAGGRVIATGPASASFISGSTRMRPPSGRAWTTASAIAPTPITIAAPEITIAERVSWSESGWLVLALYGDPEAPSVVDIAVGRGGAMWLEAPTPFTNAGISAPGNLAFVLASLGGPGERRILFDEYFHGSRRTLAASIWHSPTKWIALQLVLVSLVVLLTFSRRSGPVIPPASDSRLAPLEFVRTLGSLYQRAGATPVVLDAAARTARLGLARRFGVSTRSSPDDLAAAVARRTGHDASTLADSLRSCEAGATYSIDDKRALAVAQALGEQTRALHVFGTTTEDL